MIQRILACSIFLCTAAFAAEPAAPAPFPGVALQGQQKDGVYIGGPDGQVVVYINGKLFTEYHYKDANRPYLYPIIGPKELPMTRNHPMKDVPGEDKDHPHHRSIWWAHYNINGVDFWTDPSGKGRIVHDKFAEIKSGPQEGLIHALENLQTVDGKLIAKAESKIRFYNIPDARMMDFEITVHASETNLVFGDNKDGFMAIRINESMRLVQLDKKPGKGHIVNSEGVKDADAWGKRAAWVDYFGPINDTIAGIAMFDHPSNPRYPTWWHVRDYGLFAANPFGVHDFEKKPAGTGDMAVAKGQSVTFKYRIYFHLGDEKQAKIAERYQEFVGKLPNAK